MSRALIGVLACGLVLVAASAEAGIPDPDVGYVEMDNDGKGLASCPAGDASAYGYINVYALTATGTPIQGIPAAAFYFSVTGAGSANCTITPYDTETDVDGRIRFEAQASGTIVYGQVAITVRIYTVVLNDIDYLTCNTYDYDDNGTVDPVDFQRFASEFNSSNESSDFNWDGEVNPVDFQLFASHFNHPE